MSDYNGAEALLLLSEVVDVADVTIWQHHTLPRVCDDAVVNKLTAPSVI